MLTSMKFNKYCSGIWKKQYIGTKMERKINGG
jgi:hypothetical protein